jgi:hypothetical protein
MEGSRVSGALCRWPVTGLPRVQASVSMPKGRVPARSIGGSNLLLIWMIRVSAH